MTVRLQVFKYTCAKCGHSFNALELPDDPYGMFLMRNQSGEAALLPAFDKSEYKQVSEMLAAHPKLQGADRFKRAEILQEVFGDTCDPSPDGTAYKINRNPRCPKCDSTSMAKWECVDPPEYAVEEIPVVTNFKWAGMNDRERQQMLDVALTRLGI